MGENHSSFANSVYQLLVRMMLHALAVGIIKTCCHEIPQPLFVNVFQILSLFLCKSLVDFLSKVAVIEKVLGALTRPTVPLSIVVYGLSI